MLCVISLFSITSFLEFLLSSVFKFNKETIIRNASLSFCKSVCLTASYMYYRSYTLGGKHLLENYQLFH